MVKSILVKFCLLASLTLAFPIITQAQTPEEVRQSFLRPEARQQQATRQSIARTVKREQRARLRAYGTAQNLASVGCFAGAVADIATTGNDLERNPLLRGSDGKLNRGRAAAVKFGICGGLMVLERWLPVPAFIGKIISGAMQFGAAVHNWRR